MANKSYLEEFLKGIFKENPVFSLLLGLCPTLAVTSSALNGLAMGLATLTVLLGSNIIISLIRKLIPSKIRIPAYIMVIASLVTIVEFIMHAQFYPLYKSLGLFIPLIVVNCLILGRAEAYASKNGIFASIIDALGMGLGFTLSLTILGSIREVLGNGTIFDHIKLFGAHYHPAIIFILPPGAFITIGLIIALLNYIKGFKTRGDE